MTNPEPGGTPGTPGTPGTEAGRTHHHGWHVNRVAEDPCWVLKGVLAIEAEAARSERARIVAAVEAEQPCTCNAAYGRIFGPTGEHALECVGKTSLRNGILRILRDRS